jgi:anti-anti-sigma factor
MTRPNAQTTIQYGGVKAMQYSSQATSNGGIKYSISGQLSAQHHSVFRALLKELEGMTFSQCTLNLEALEFIDSGGLGLLLLANDMCKKRGGILVLEGAAGNVLKILTLSHFQKIMTMTD